MQLQSITIKNFRCFELLDITIEQPLVLIQGANGTGKTTLLEALHYACYLRSFRTHLPADLIRTGATSFFVKATLMGTDVHEVQVGLADKRRLVKLNQKAITTYKELFDIYRVVTITEDDINLIRGGPEERRAFLDQVCLMQNPEYATTLRAFRHVLASRNALLRRGPVNQESYKVWTDKLIDLSCTMFAHRTAVLHQLQEQVRAIIEQLLGGRYTVQLLYQSSIDYQVPLEQLREGAQGRMHDETRAGRSLFGAHLDDFHIQFQGQRARLFASRGQQKLLVLLLKMAHIKLLAPHLVLLDDFMTDFDDAHMQDLIRALTQLPCQLIFTVPLEKSPLDQILGGQATPLQRIVLK